MVLFNYSTKELTAKVVYYGPALCGKTSNLQWIHEKLPIKNKGKMLSLATETDRTLFFDFLPIEIGAIRGMRTRIQLYTVPGQVFYNATRRMVLKGADAIVFVCDSQEPMLEANLESYENLRQNLEANEISSEEIPVVFQFNKRDLPNALPIEILNERLNPGGLPFFEAIAPNGAGVEDTLKAVTKLVFRSLSARYGEAVGASQPTRSSGASRPGSLPGLAGTSDAPVAPASESLLGELSFTPKPRLVTPAPPVLSQPPPSPVFSQPPSASVLSQPPSPPAVSRLPSAQVSRPPSQPVVPRPPSAPAVSRPPSAAASPDPQRPARPVARPPASTSLPALQPLPEDLTMPSPSLHSDMTPLPRSSVDVRSPTDTLVSSASEADELRRRISTPLHQEEDLELEEIDLDDALPMQQALPPDPEPSETVAPAPRSAPAQTTEVEIPIELSVPPGATRLQLRLKLVLNLKQR